jgi:uncharacterized protein
MNKNHFLKSKRFSPVLIVLNSPLCTLMLTALAHIQIRKSKKSFCFFNLFTAIFVLSLLSPLASSTALAAVDTQKVYDYYGYFTQEEMKNLEEISAEYGEEGKIDIVMIIADGLGGKTPKKYMEDFYDEMGFGYDQEFGDTSMILINLEKDNRWVEIQSYGQAQYYINNDRTEYILDDVADILKNQKYYDALEEFAKQAAYYMNEEKGVKIPSSTDVGSGSSDSVPDDYGNESYDGDSDYYGEKEENIFFNTWAQLVIALVIGGVTVGVMAATSGGTVTVDNRTYLDAGNSSVVASRDDYIRTTTTRVRKPQNNDNNNSGPRSSGGGGVSSGGNSHSGGGRSF